MTPFRERDVRQVVRDLLDQTGAFDGVYLSGLPEDRGGRAGESALGLHRARRDHRGPTPGTTRSGDPLMTCRLNLASWRGTKTPRSATRRPNCS